MTIAGTSGSKIADGRSWFFQKTEEGREEAPKRIERAGRKRSVEKKL